MNIVSIKDKFNFEWIIIGQNESDRLPTIVRKALKENYHDNNIKLVGRKDELEVVGLLRDADIFVQVSHIENSPNSLNYQQNSV